MSASDVVESSANGQAPSSLTTAAARNLATTTKSVPQMQGISSRWLLRVLPWIETAGGTYRVNRRLSYAVGDGRVNVITTGSQVSVIPEELRELPLLRQVEGLEVLTELAGRFEQQEFEAGQTLVETGQVADHVFVIAHGKVNKVGLGKYADPVVLDVLADGDYFGDRRLVESEDVWAYTMRAVTPTTALVLPQQALEELVERSAELRGAVEAYRARLASPQNAHGEAEIGIASGHEGEPSLASAFADYDPAPREYQLSVAQTVLRVHTRVADLFNQPHDQTEQQLRLTIEALRERQEHELVNNPDFGLLHNAEFSNRISTRTGPPTPDDLDELLAVVWKDPEYFLAHAHTIAAFGRECNSRGVYPGTVDIGGHHVPSWRGIPILPCNKLPISDTGVSSIMLMRTGEATQGVVGLRQTGLPDEFEPGLNVRFMHIDEQAVISYLVSTYYSAAVLVPDALGILENVELGHGA